MTRSECEARLLEILRQAVEVYRQYNPSGQRLCLTFFDGRLDVVAFGDGVRGGYGGGSRE